MLYRRTELSGCGKRNALTGVDCVRRFVRVVANRTQWRLIAVDVNVLLGDRLTGDKGNTHQKQEREYAPAANESAVRVSSQNSDIR